MEKELIKSYKRYLFIIPLVLFILITFLVSNHLLDNIDHSITMFCIKHRYSLLTEFMKLCSNLGSTPFYVVAVIVFCLIDYKESLKTGIHLLILQVINRVIKFIIKRPRPAVIFRLVNETNYSYFSGHALSAMAGYGSLIVKINDSSLKYKRVIQVLLGVMIFLISISRVYLGVHYLSDVIAGSLVALSYILFFYYNTKLL